MDNIIRIPENRIPEIFNTVAPFIQRALNESNGELTLQHVYIDLINARKQLWVISDENYKTHAVAVTEIVQYPAKRIARIIFLGGEGLERWSKLLSDTVIEHAREYGATCVEVIGRKGWDRFLKGMGYKTKYYHLVREV